MADIAFGEIELGEVEAVVALWECCGLIRPWNDPRADIAFASTQTNAAVLVGRAGGAIAASAMVGHDGHRGAVYYVAVDPAARGRGYGRSTMAAAEAWLAARGVWKLNLMVRPDNAGVIQFYKALGYITEERVNLSKRL